MKKKLPKEILELVAHRFRILGEPIRLEILQCLGENELMVTEIVSAIGASQPNVSKHLRVMLEAGILKRRQEKNCVYYSIADESIFLLCDTVCNSLKTLTENQSKIMSFA
jgi:ArsR family transcriptional regulator